MTESERRGIGLIDWEGVSEAEKAIMHARKMMVNARKNLVNEARSDRASHLTELLSDLVSRYDVAISDIEKVYYFHSTAISEQFYWDD